MKFFFLLIVLCASYTAAVWKWGGVGESYLSKMSYYFEQEKKVVELENEIQKLKVEVSKLNFELSKNETEKQIYLSRLNNSKKVSRSIASVDESKSLENDMVQYEIYQWTPEKLLAIGEKELFFRNYEKSAQFYNVLIEKFSHHKIVKDNVLFGAGMAAYESKKHYDWAEKYFSRLVKDYPRSPYQRGGKLWLGLAHYQQGNQKKFVSTVEEFKTKYRNTDEWKILSRYYEDINLKVKK